MPTVTLSPDAAVTIAGGEVVTWKECLRRLAASPSVGGWEDISTAPKDGRDILILANGMAIEARYAPGEWGPDIPGEVREYNGPVWVAFDDLTQFEIEEGSLEGGRDHHGSVTHWMPLPPPVSTGSRPQEAVPTEQAERPVLARHIDEWHEDMGDVLWWTNPVREAPYVGSPLCLGRAYALSIGDFTTSVDLGGWPGYHSWWTPLPALPVFTPQPAEGCSSNEGAGK